MRNKGFTLVELLAVVTIFAIICVLAIPPILNQVNNNKGAVSDANLKIIYRAADLYIDEIKANSTYCIALQELVDRDLLASPIKDMDNGTELNLTRKVKVVTDKNKMATYSLLAVGDTCVPSEAIPSNKTYLVGEVVYFDPTGAVSDCAAGKEWTPTSTATTCYKWNVIKNNVNSVEMLLDHNTTPKIAWSSTMNNSLGPVPVYNKLKTNTSSWTKVEPLTASDNVTGIAYGNKEYILNYEGMNARLIGGQEIADIAGDKAWTLSTPSGTVYSENSWLYQNTLNNGDDTTQGYWTDSAHIQYTNTSYYMGYLGSLASDKVNFPFSFGVRPVVRVLKSNI